MTYAELVARAEATRLRIAAYVAGDRELAAEKVAALEWCRAHGSPHCHPIPQETKRD